MCARSICDLASDAVRLRWGPVVVATVAAEPGAERLEGRHLRGLLRTRLARALAKAMELSESLASHAPADQRIATRAGTEKRPA